MYLIDKGEVSFGKLKLLKECQVRLPIKGLVLIGGANGSGKTTFLRYLADEFKRRKMLKGSAISFTSAIQAYERTVPLRGEEFIRLYSQAPLPPIYVEPFQALLERRIDRMSTGEFQALVLISNLLSHSKLNIFDEPFSHLSEKWSEFFAQRISEIAADELVVLVSHQVGALKGRVDQYFQFENKELRKMTNDCLLKSEKGAQV